MNWTQRVHQLLRQLEDRAKQCPGLYPVQSSSEFVRMVGDYMARRKSSPAASDEETALCLEELWRNPEMAYQLNAQSLIQRGASPFNRDAGDAPMENVAG